MLLGVGVDDTQADVDYLAEKIVGLRIFEDPAGKMNLSLANISGAMLVVSQISVGDCRKGKRPGFTDPRRRKRPSCSSKRSSPQWRSRGSARPPARFGEHGGGACE